MIRRDEQDMQHAYGNEKPLHNFNLKLGRLWRLRRKLEDNIKIDLNYMACEGVKWI